jgi:hypothetical protein
MEGKARDRRVDTRQYRRSIRVTLATDGRAVRVVRTQRVAMVAPASSPGAPSEDQAGFWIEVRDRSGALLYYRVLHNPAQTHQEIFSPEPDRGIRALPIEPASTEFDVVIPDIEEGAELVVRSSPLDFKRALEPAREMTRFDLTGGREGGEGGEGIGYERI